MIQKMFGFELICMVALIKEEQNFAESFDGKTLSVARQ